MRRTRGAWAAVLLCVAAGCFTRPDGSRWPFRPPSSDPAQARSFSPTGLIPAPTPVPAGTLYAETLLIERPVGDPYLNRELWRVGLPVGSEEIKALWAENGLRAVILGGNLSAGFVKLIASETDTVNPQGLTFGSRKEVVVPTAGPTDPCEFEVLTDLAGKRKPVKLRQARAGFLVRPETAPGGRVRVWCEPQIQHGERQDWLRPTADGTGFTMQGEVPLERFPALGFEAVLAPTDYLVIGWPAAADGTLGAAMFAVEADNRPRQRVLVVRVTRIGEAPSDLPPIPNLRRPSIAAEASRGK